MKYLGVDWGLKKIGLAVSEGDIASPLGVLEIKSLKDGVEKIIKVCKKEEIHLAVLGKPGGNIGKKVEKAVKILKKSGLKIETADETLSTQKAKTAMIGLGFSQKARREDNAMAAAIILQDYLDTL